MTMRHGAGALLAFLALFGCGSGGSGDGELPGENEVVEELVFAKDGTWVEPDLAGVDTVPKWDIGNRPPMLDKLPGATVKMGGSVEVELGDHFADPESDDSELVLSWSALHVAVELAGPSKLRLIGPVDWSGVDLLQVTVTDPEGLSDTEQMAVTVEFVDAPEPGDVVVKDVGVDVVEPDVVEETVSDAQDVEPQCGQVRFEYSGGGNAVYVAGSFNGWSENSWKMAKDGGGVWVYETVLDPGEYQYKFVVDGTWTHDVSNPNTVPDGYGKVNSLLVVPACN